MESNVEVGVVLSELESEYERSKKFLEDLYLSLAGNRNSSGDPDSSERPTSALAKTDKDTVPEENGISYPFGTFELMRENSGLSTFSDASSSYPLLPELRPDGRSPNTASSSGQRPGAHTRDGPATASHSTPKRKASLKGAFKKPPVLLVSCPVLESPAPDDLPSQSPAVGTLDSYPQLRMSQFGNGAGGVMPNVYSSLDSLLLPSPQSIPVGRHRRSSLDFFPAPPAHMRKVYDSNAHLLGMPTPAASTGQLEGLVTGRASQPGKTRSLEVMGGQPSPSLSLSTHGAPPLQPINLQPTTTRPPQAAAPQPQLFRRGSNLTSSTANGSGGGGTTAAAATALHPTPPSPLSVQPGGPGHPEQHHSSAAGAAAAGAMIDSPTLARSLSGIGAHLSRTHLDSGAQSAGHSGSPSSVSSPNLLPPLQPSGAATSPLSAIAAANPKHLHAASDPTAATAAGRGSWSGAPQSGCGPLSAGALLPDYASAEHSPRERTRAARFTRCNPSQPALSSPGSVAGAGGGGAVAPPALQLNPTPPPVAARDRRTTAGDPLDRPVPRTQSLLSATVPKNGLPSPSRGGSFRSTGLAFTADGTVGAGVGGALSGSSGGGVEAAAAAADAAVLMSSSPVGSGGAAVTGPLGGGQQHYASPLHHQHHQHHPQHPQHPQQHPLLGRLEMRVRSVGGALAH